jgi:hypothetical protein
MKDAGQWGLAKVLTQMPLGVVCSRRGAGRDGIGEADGGRTGGGGFQSPGSLTR